VKLSPNLFSHRVNYLRAVDVSDFTNFVFFSPCPVGLWGFGIYRITSLYIFRSFCTLIYFFLGKGWLVEVADIFIFKGKRKDIGIGLFL
jgi:hypothetical protein